VAEYQPSIRYGFVRGRQLEGSYPGDRQTGVWPITSKRIAYGWGLPPEEAWPYPARDAVWPDVEPAGIDHVAKQYRRHPPYRRVRTIAACKEAIAGGSVVGVSLDITDKWSNPAGGRIPASSSHDICIPTHHVTLNGHDPARDEFRFQNTWGPFWGDRGFGYISSGVLEATWWEGWKRVDSTPINTPPRGTFPDPTVWAFEENDGSTLHWLELVDEKDDRVAWVSAVDNGKSLEIEELFVRPRYRRQGHGKSLFRNVHKMAQSRGLSFRMWISFADRAPQNLEVVEKIVRPVGLSIRASGVRWAPLVAAPVWSRTTEPHQTFDYPEKPPSVPSDLLKLISDILVGLGTGIVSSFIYDALKSWLNPTNGKRIRAKLGDLELETSAVSEDEFRKLLGGLRELKEEADIRAKLLEAGLTITIISVEEKSATPTLDSDNTGSSSDG
jgi:GNAT superfamily N-acetyltransferase